MSIRATVSALLVAPLLFAGLQFHLEIQQYVKVCLSDARKPEGEQAASESGAKSNQGNCFLLKINYVGRLIVHRIVRRGLAFPA